MRDSSYRQGHFNNTMQAPYEVNSFMSAFAHAAVGMAITDLYGRFVGVNDAFCRITGYSCAELRSLDFLSITHPDYREWHAKFINQLMERQVPAFVLEKPYVKKSGELVWVQDSVSLLCDREGKAVNILALCQDISEREIAQEALRESEERFRVQFRATPVPIFSWRRVGNDFILVDFNDAADRMTAHWIANLLGRKASELYVNTPEVIDGLERCFNQKKPIRKTGDFRLLSTGELKHLDVSFVWVPPDLVMIHTEDITERKRAESELTKQKEILQRVFDQIPLMISCIDENGQLKLVNGEWERTLGWTYEEIGPDNRHLLDQVTVIGWHQHRNR